MVSSHISLKSVWKCSRIIWTLGCSVTWGHICRMVTMLPNFCRPRAWDTTSLIHAMCLGERLGIDGHTILLARCCSWSSSAWIQALQSFVSHRCPFASVTTLRLRAADESTPKSPARSVLAGNELSLRHVYGSARRARSSRRVRYADKTSQRLWLGARLPHLD